VGRGRSRAKSVAFAKQGARRSKPQARNHQLEVILVPPVVTLPVEEGRRVARRSISCHACASKFRSLLPRHTYV
jgi:hypothetical protein